MQRKGQCAPLFASKARSGFGSTVFSLAVAGALAFVFYHFAWQDPRVQKQVTAGKAKIEAAVKPAPSLPGLSVPKKDDVTLPLGEGYVPLTTATTRVSVPPTGADGQTKWILRPNGTRCFAQFPTADVELKRAYADGGVDAEWITDGPLVRWWEEKRDITGFRWRNKSKDTVPVDLKYENCR